MDGGGRGKAGELSVGRGAGEGEHLWGELVAELRDGGEEKKYESNEGGKAKGVSRGKRALHSRRQRGKLEKTRELFVKLTFF